MKRIVLLLWTAFMLMVQISAQTTQETIIRVDSLNQKFGKALAVGQLVRLKNSMNIYQLRKVTTINNTLTQVLADPTWFYDDHASPSFTNYVKVTPTATTPATPAEGMIYAKTDHTLNYYTGTAWVNLLSAVNNNFQGLAWNEVTDTYVRQGTLAGQTLGASPGDLLLPVQSKMKGCVLNINGTVNYYLSSTDWAYKASGAASNLTGADGQVMVEIPKFYIQYQKNGNYHIWNVSIDSLAGYTRHPAFIKDGAYVNYRYIGAYEAVLWDATTDSTYRDYRAGVTINPAADKLTSVSGFRPVTNFTRASGRAMAARLGSGWRQQDYDLVNAVEWLILVEYGTFYIQNIAEVGPGITNIGDWAAYNNYYSFNRTGSGNGIGNASGDNAGGVTCAADSNKYSKYRGISNFYGHVYKFVDGININDNHPYISNNSAVWADNTSTGYTDPGITLAASDGWGKTLVNSARMMLPASVGGGSTTYVTDYYYQAAGWRVAFLGGGAFDGVNAGPWDWNLDSGSGSSYQAFGSRISY